KLPPAQLHYMISDDTDSIVIECMKDGMHIYDNPTHVLTNNPPFKEQISRLNDYMYLTNKQPENTFSKDLNLAPYSRGFGA
ncbi:linear amide C-N hydrolase, partial [Desulfovibrio desulfuricans]|nr:linear amide C-N hydrolase [Desulfovibrio desulfuricans]